MTASIDELSCDFLILGSGGAGLMAALHAYDANPKLKIVVVAKGLVGEERVYAARAGRIQCRARCEGFGREAFFRHAFRAGSTSTIRSSRGRSSATRRTSFASSRPKSACSSTGALTGRFTKRRSPVNPLTGRCIVAIRRASKSSAGCTISSSRATSRCSTRRARSSCSPIATARASRVRCCCSSVPGNSWSLGRA